jgi:hypothetical protein
MSIGLVDRRFLPHQDCLRRRELGAAAWLRSFVAALLRMTTVGRFTFVVRFALEPLGNEVAWSKAVAEPPHSKSSGRGVLCSGGIFRNSAIEESLRRCASGSGVLGEILRCAQNDARGVAVR